MRTREMIFACSVLLVSTFIVLPAKGQQDTSSTRAANENSVTDSVVSVSRDTLVIRTEDNQFQLFTYTRGAVRPKSLAQGARVRVIAGPADENGTRDTHGQPCIQSRGSDLKVESMRANSNRVTFFVADALF